MIWYAEGDENREITSEELSGILNEVYDKIGRKEKILIVPPDFTRYHSRAGEITSLSYKYYRDSVKDILPALGTHFPMTGKELEIMFPDVPLALFREHKWREELDTLGVVPPDYLKSVSDGLIDYSWPAQVNKLLSVGGHDLILSIGQVVPHEVIGMANYNKNIFVGTGGKEGIDKSHFLGAVYGMEKIMGRADTPVRRALNYASDNFATQLPIVYILTVIGKNENNRLVIRGLYIGDDYECFRLASELSLKVNFTMLDKPLDKIVVYLEPGEFKSTWLGNKSIYRTRMAIADKGELVVMAPAVGEFGEDPDIDRLIRKFGYRTSEKILELVKEGTELSENLSAAAHLIHGSSENRFDVTYCAGKLSREEIESVGYKYNSLEKMMKRYDPKKLRDGFNRLPDGEEIYFISNPALGLWSAKEKFM